MFGSVWFGFAVTSAKPGAGSLRCGLGWMKFY
jgi:hypothetical protein